MHVDRSRFLFLTASLAAAACNQPGPAASPDTGGAEPAGSKDASAATTTSGGSNVWLEIEPGTEDKQPAAGDSNCNNQVGSPASCSLSAPAGHCENFDMNQRMCSSLPSIMQPRAAEAAVDCMLAANGTFEVCEWDLWTQCVGAGMQASCIEPSTRGECDSIASQCGGALDVFSCQLALSSVRAQHQGQVASCVREFCEVSWCVAEIGMF